MFATDPSDKHQHHAGCPDEQGRGKIGRCDQQANHGHRKDHGQKSLFEIFYLILFPAEQPADIHDQGQLGQVGSLKCHIDDGQPDPAAAFIQFYTKK